MGLHARRASPPVYDSASAMSSSGSKFALAALCGAHPGRGLAWGGAIRTTYSGWGHVPQRPKARGTSEGVTVGTQPAHDVPCCHGSCTMPATESMRCALALQAPPVAWLGTAASRSRTAVTPQYVSLHKSLTHMDKHEWGQNERRASAFSPGPRWPTRKGCWPKGIWTLLGGRPVHGERRSHGRTHNVKKTKRPGGFGWGLPGMAHLVH